MTMFLDLAGSFALKLRTVVAGFVSFFLLFFIVFGHDIINPMMIFNHRFLITTAPILMGICFLYFGHFLKKMEGE